MPSTRAAAELDDLREKLKDPAVVHLAMLRGDIAKPDIRTMLHAYGEAALARWDAAAVQTQEDASALLDHLQQRMDAAKARGFKWDAIRLDTDSSVRDQLRAAIAASPPPQAPQRQEDAK
jgi:hypothetical protein